jgi:hypothetical protein
MHEREFWAVQLRPALAAKSCGADVQFRKEYVMQKGYICTGKQDDPPNDNRNVYTFCPDPEHAMYWKHYVTAKIHCDDLNRGVTIPPGGNYLCHNFAVEEVEADRFLIFCEAPFDDLRQSPLYFTTK